MFQGFRISGVSRVFRVFRVRVFRCFKVLGVSVFLALKP